MGLFGDATPPRAHRRSRVLTRSETSSHACAHSTRLSAVRHVSSASAAGARDPHQGAQGFRRGKPDDNDHQANARAKLDTSAPEIASWMRFPRSLSSSGGLLVGVAAVVGPPSCRSFSSLNISLISSLSDMPGPWTSSPSDALAEQRMLRAPQPARLPSFLFQLYFLLVPPPTRAGAPEGAAGRKLTHRARTASAWTDAVTAPVGDANGNEDIIDTRLTKRPTQRECS